ncbi:MAG: hypothetical protein JWN86_3079 [Planctomycetota bacterium]|nr:hypothetical protein [Planctomycetota bacterium]
MIFKGGHLSSHEENAIPVGILTLVPAPVSNGARVRKNPVPANLPAESNV